MCGGKITTFMKITTARRLRPINSAVKDIIMRDYNDRASRARVQELTINVST